MTATPKWKAKRNKTKSLFVALTAVLLLCACSHAWAKDSFGNFGELEYMGSSLATRAELEKMLHLSPGAKYASMEKACERVKKSLTDRRIICDTDIVDGGSDALFIVIDISEPGKIVPTRPLSDPRYIKVPTEKPNLILKELRERLTLLTYDGRSFKETYSNGVKHYSDAVADEKTRELASYGSVPELRDAWLNIVQSDPNPDRRIDAIELLNWSGNYPQTIFKIMPALDDVNKDVRVAVAKFIYPRLELLPYDFDFGKLTSAFCRQICRPSHGDRLRAMACLSVLVRDKPEMVPPTREVALDQINLIAERTRIPPLKELTERVKLLLSNYREKTRTKKPVVEDSNF